jgi:threonyl-tRNA synthetase
MAVIGKREADSGMIALRIRGAGKKQDIMAVDDFVARVVREKKERALVP